MSAGFKTTEFWMSAVGFVGGAALCVCGLLQADDVIALGGTALAGLSLWTYGHARGKAKGRPYLPPGGKL